jgi:hypothetical protein
MSEEAKLAGQAVVGWNRSAIDWGMLGTAGGIARRLQRVVAGSVVLMHDGRNQHNRPDQLVQILPQFLEQLRSVGLSTARLDDSAFAWAIEKESRQ